MNRKSPAPSMPIDDADRIGFDLDELLHPAGAFNHPSDVVNDPDLTLNEKRAILASWASDACAVEAVPGLRKNPAGRVVTFDDVMDALRALDTQVNKLPRRVLKHERRFRWFARRDGGESDQGASRH